jgi:hypothetical protein
MKTVIRCRGCGLQVSPLARFCFACRAPDPDVRGAREDKPGRRKVWFFGTVGAVAWAAACIASWAVWLR